MAAEVLVEPRIDDGRRLLVELVRSGFDVAVAAWLKTEDEGLWHLYIGSAAVTASKLGDAYRTVYVCLSRLPDSVATISDIKLISTSEAIVRGAIDIRDRNPGGRLATWYGGELLGNVGVEKAYIYERILPQLTREEVVQTVAGSMTRPGYRVKSSTITLRDGKVLLGVPTGLDMRIAPSGSSEVTVKIMDDADGSIHQVPAEDVVNIQ